MLRRVAHRCAAASAASSTSRLLACPANDESHDERPDLGPIIAGRVSVGERVRGDELGLVLLLCDRWLRASTGLMAGQADGGRADPVDSTTRSSLLNPLRSIGADVVPVSIPTGAGVKAKALREALRGGGRSTCGVRTSMVPARGTSTLRAAGATIVKGYYLYNSCGFEKKKEGEKEMLLVRRMSCFAHKGHHTIHLFFISAGSVAGGVVVGGCRLGGWAGWMGLLSLSSHPSRQWWDLLALVRRCVSCALEKDQGSQPPSHKIGYGSNLGYIQPVGRRRPVRGGGVGGG